MKLLVLDELVSTFFSNERKMEKTFSREKLCLDSEEIYHFFDQLCDLLQYILFPYNSFNNEIFRLFTKLSLIVQSFFCLVILNILNI